jgi:hypothetical protein
VNLKFSRNIFEKYSNIKFHENPTSWSRVLHADTRAGKGADRQTDITKLRVTFRNFANAPKNFSLCLPVSLKPVPDYEWSQYIPAYIPFARTKIFGLSYYHFRFVKQKVFLCNHTMSHTLNKFPFGNSGFSNDPPLRLD